MTAALDGRCDDDFRHTEGVVTHVVTPISLIFSILIYWCDGVTKVYKYSTHRGQCLCDLYVVRLASRVLYPLTYVMILRTSSHVTRPVLVQLPCE